MNKAAVRAAVIGGVLGGVTMAVWLMFILWLTGIGFWTLLNLITNTVWRSAPLGDKFSVASLIIGLVVHVLMSLLFGSLIAVAAWWLPMSRSLVIAGGALFGPILWLVMQYGIWHAVDPAAAQVITPWVFAVAHLIFGVLAAATAAIVTSDEKTSARVREAMPDADGPVVQDAWRPAVQGARHGRGLAADRQQASALTQGIAPAPYQASGPAPHPGSGPATYQGSTPVPHPRLLTARNDGRMRTMVYTSGGPGMVTDEPVARGGTGSGLTPLETIIGALCGSTGITFAKAASEVGFRYDGINFEASFTVDPRSLTGEPGIRSGFHTVRIQARVRVARPDHRLADVAQMTERRCAVRNLLADSGVTVDLLWSAVSPDAPAPEVPETPGTSRRPVSWP
jgi:uncharacterized OsmC-like protein